MHLETERAIKYVLDGFERELCMNLNLTPVQGPLFVAPETGLNDNLSGTEKAVSFCMKDGKRLEIVHSLAKWKRSRLHEYSVLVGEGITTRMTAIRKDEELDPLHSILVPQLDWERVISKEQRNKTFLTSVVRKIYDALLTMEKEVHEKYGIEPVLPKGISFVSTQELADLLPTLSSKERENSICKEKGAVFLMDIGDKLANGQKHDDRAPDYDDWTLNGDILLWHEPLQCALELSSMGIRVDACALMEQMPSDSPILPYHENIIGNVYPLTIGGGIGQSRLVMFLLKKKHIGEVQASVWNNDTLEYCREQEIQLL